MSKSIVITTDLGTFRAFNVVRKLAASSPSLEELDAFETIYGDDRISRRVSDQAGQFSKGAASFAVVNDGANGERHNMQLEDRRRGITLIAARIDALLVDPGVEGCFFAAASDVNGAILNRLSPVAKAKIQVNLSCNLVNTKKQQLLERFLQSARHK